MWSLTWILCSGNSDNHRARWQTLAAVGIWTSDRARWGTSWVFAHRHSSTSTTFNDTEFICKCIKLALRKFPSFNGFCTFAYTLAWAEQNGILLLVTNRMDVGRRWPATRRAVTSHPSQINSMSFQFNSSYFYCRRRDRRIHFSIIFPSLPSKADSYLHIWPNLRWWPKGATRPRHK